MFRAGIDEQFFDHGIAEFIFGQHAFDRDFDQAFWSAGADLGRGEFFQTTGIAGVVLVDFHIFLVAGKSDFICIDYDDVVAGVDVWGIFRVMFAPEHGGDTGRKATQDLTVSVDHKPAAVDFFLLDGPCFITQCIHSNRILKWIRIFAFFKAGRKGRFSGGRLPRIWQRFPKRNCINGW